MTSHVPTSKRDKIVYLLDHWEDIFSPPLRSNGGGGGGGPALLPGMSRHHSVVELARCLSVLKQVAPSQHDHLMAFHTAERKIAHVPKFHKGKPVMRSTGRRDARGRPIMVQDTRPKLDRLRPAWVDNGKVRKAEQRLCDLFRGSVKLPEELEDALMLSNAEIEEKQRKRRVGRFKTVAA